MTTRRDCPENRVLVLVGPTATGKTKIAIELAKLLATEVISADSMQIYKAMDIGTAKPSVEEMSGVRHHMIDIVEPWKAFSTGQYIERVRAIIDTLHSQGKIPIVTGGTGLYMRAITRGLCQAPSADYTLRNALLRQETEQQGFLHRRLSELDPHAALRINPKDHRRLIRALEVCIKTRSTMSYLQRQNTEPLPYRFIKLCISRQRQELYEIINKRVDEMIKKGLVEEVQRVIGMILTHRPCPSSEDELTHLMSFTSMQAIGYKEIAMHLYGRLNRPSAIALIKQKTRNYAKRQFTWFRAERDLSWLDASDDEGIITFVLDQCASQTPRLQRPYDLPQSF